MQVQKLNRWHGVILGAAFGVLLVGQGNVPAALGMMAAAVFPAALIVFLDLILMKICFVEKNHSATCFALAMLAVSCFLAFTA